MSDVRVAVTWGDVLLIVAVAAIGTGVCAVSAALADYTVAFGAPTDQAIQDSLQVSQLEQQLATARDERAFLLVQRRDIAMRRMRTAAAREMNRTVLAAGATSPRLPKTPESATRDSIMRVDTSMMRAQQTDSLVALALDAAMVNADRIVVERNGSLSLAKRSVVVRLRWAQLKHALKRFGVTALYALIGVAVILSIVRTAMRGAAEAWRVRRKLVLTPALLVIALVFLQQVGGLLLALGVTAIAVATYIAWALFRAAR